MPQTPHILMNVTELRTRLQALEQAGFGASPLTVYPAGTPEDVDAVSPRFVTTDFHVCAVDGPDIPGDGYILLSFAEATIDQVP